MKSLAITDTATNEVQILPNCYLTSVDVECNSSSVENSWTINISMNVTTLETAQAIYEIFQNTHNKCISTINKNTKISTKSLENTIEINKREEFF